MGKKAEYIPCAFCGERGVTREHLLAQWIRDLPGVADLRRLANNHQPKIVNRITYSNDGLTRPAVVLKPERQGSRRHATNTKIRQLCGKCNNEWMARLEDETDPLGTALETGTGTHEIGSTEADVLSRWAFKTVAVWELNDLEHRTIASQDVLRLRDGQGLPYGRAEVYLFHSGAEERKMSPCHLGGPVMVAPEGDMGRVELVGRISTSTICLLRLGFLVRYVDGLSLDFLPPVTDSRLHRIFPFDEPVTWPTEALQNDAITAHCNSCAFEADAATIQAKRVPMIADHTFG